MLHEYQHTAVDWLFNRLASRQKLGAALWLDPGLGKTLITLQFIERMRRYGRLKTLVVAPLRPVSIVWPREIEKWGFDLPYQIVHGPKKATALRASAAVYITNYESLQWLSEQNQQFDLTVFDESTKLKNWSAKRTKAVRKMLPRLGKRIELTGTPTPNSYIDLHSQMFVLDDGEALGKTATYFRNTFCGPQSYQERRYNRWSIKDEATKAIEAAISPMVLRMSAEDYLDMPELVTNDIWVRLPAEIREVYDRAERDLFVQLDSGQSLTASTASALYGLCRQLANGGGYDKSTGDRIPVHVHDTKADALEDLVDELGGKSVLVAYQFHHDLERLQKRFPLAPVIKGGTPPAETDRIVDEWSRGEHHILLVQPQSLSHGVNMQAGGHDIVWFGLTDQREIYDQFIARLYRQGQASGQVRVHRILTIDTVEEAMVQRLEDKGDAQQSLLRSIQEYAKRRGL